MYINDKKTFALATLGCRVNQYETQVIREDLIRLGWEEVGFDDVASAYLVNTCAVTAESVRKGKQMLRRALRRKEANPDCIVCICGCFSQGAGDDPILEQVDLVAGNTQKGTIPNRLEELISTPIEKRTRQDLRQDIARVKQYEELSLCRSHNARAFVKIQDGCNSFCSYCYVPLVRGRVRSRGKIDILNEVSRLSQNGYQEIVLTGIETGAYGEDFSEPASLPSLVEEISTVSGIERIRFGSLKPSLFTDEFCSRLAVLNQVMPHFHLSLQSGSDRVLAAMRRKYGREEALRAIDTIYRYFPDAGLSADLICGFPGEKESDFLDTVSLVEEARLLHTHIFPFSPREGTRAYEMPDDVPSEEKKRRCAYLLSKAKEMSVEFAQKREGRIYRVLCERIRSGFAFGYTENFIYTKTPAGSDLAVGEVFPTVLSSERTFSVETMTVVGKNVKTVDNFTKKV